MIFIPKYHISIILQVKVKQNTLKIKIWNGFTNEHYNGLIFIIYLQYITFKKNSNHTHHLHKTQKNDLKRILILSKHTIKRYLFGICAS